ncbi:MAG: hypothetical protein AB8B50_14745 [Pirellulaceae bacterium]
MRNARLLPFPYAVAFFAAITLSQALLPTKLSAETPQGNSSRAVRSDAVRSIPISRLPRKLQSSVRDVVEKPSFFRRMPTQQIECDPEVFRLLVRRPEVMVNIWQIMGITNVSAERVSPYAFVADDGVGTHCRCDLIYATDNLHIYFGEGDYDGSMTPRGVTGNCICVLRSQNTQNSAGETVVRGTMDVFLKLDNFGADILAKSVAPFVGKTADFNFVETAKFMSQISQVCVLSPLGAKTLASKLTNVQPAVQQEFARVIARVAARRMNSIYGNTPPDPSKLPESAGLLAQSNLARPIGDRPIGDRPTANSPRPQTGKRLGQSKDTNSGQDLELVLSAPNWAPKTSRENSTDSVLGNQLTSTTSRTPASQAPTTLEASLFGPSPSAAKTLDPSDIKRPQWIAPRKDSIYMRR